MIVSHIRCPLCGKLSHLNSFNPENFSDEINVVTMESLGRPRGFSIVDEQSVFDDPDLVSMLSERVKRLYQILCSDQSEEGPQTSNAEDSVLTFEKELEEANEKISELEDSAEEAEDRDERLLEEINEVLGDIHTEAFTDLDSAIKVLIEQYQDLLEESEDEN